MGDTETFSLKVTNRSDNPDLTFGLYTVAPIADAHGRFPIAWQAQPLNKGNSITFSWKLEFALLFSAQGSKSGATWVEQGDPVVVSDGSSATNTTQLSFDRDYNLNLLPSGRPVVPGEVFMETTSTVPHWSQDKGPSVALAIATGDGKLVPAIAGNSGPNLTHKFDLHPTYYLRAGDITVGVMADLDTVTDGQKVVFAGGSRYAAYIFNEDNEWVPDTSPH